MRNVAKDKLGRYIKTAILWTPDQWDAGYYDNRGRFRVYRPDYPRAYKGGYALRAHVVWWLYRGEPHPQGTELHHKDGTRDNDKIENLIPLNRSEHRLAHAEEKPVLVCLTCGKQFQREIWRVRINNTKFCSKKCWDNYPRKHVRITKSCIECGTPFETIPAVAAGRKYCSPRCSAIHTWRERHAHSS